MTLKLVASNDHLDISMGITARIGASIRSSSKFVHLPTTWPAFRADYLERPWTVAADVVTDPSAHTVHLPKSTTHPKNYCPWVTRAAPLDPSAPAPRKLAHMNQIASILPYDIDHPEPGQTFDDLCAALRNLGWEAFVHTTASHTPDKPRFRVWLPVADGYSSDELRRLARAVHAALRNAGFKHEYASENERWPQAWFLPLATPDYQSAHIRGTEPVTIVARNLDPDTPNPVIPETPASMAETIANLPNKSAIDNPAPDLPSWHVRFNRVASIEAIIEAAGYTRHSTSEGERWLHPGSESNSPGTIINKAEHGQWDILIEFNTSGPLHATHPDDPDRLLARDPFECLRILHCGGDYARAAAEAQRQLAAIAPAPATPATPAASATPRRAPHGSPDFKYASKGVRLVPCRHNALQLLMHDQRFQTPDGKPPVMWDPWRCTPIVHPALRSAYPDADALAAAIETAHLDHEQALSDDGLVRGQPVSVQVCQAAVEDYARRHPVNTLAEHVRSLPDWDGTPRVETFFIDYLGAEDSPANRMVAQKFFMGMVARALYPGCAMPWMLVLHGPQGIGKTAFIREIAGPDRYIEAGAFGGLGHYSQKQSAELMVATRNAWVVEVAEQLAPKGASASRWKAAVSQSIDAGRLPYARGVTEQPRRFVFYATSNDSQIFHDPTGMRRLVPVEVHGVSTPIPELFDRLRAERDQMLAEARAMLDSKPPRILLTPTEEQMLDAARAAIDAPPNEVLDAIVSEALVNPSLPWWRDDGHTSLREMAIRCEATDSSFKLDLGDQRRVKEFSDALKRVGFKPLGRQLRFGEHGKFAAWLCPAST